MYCKTSFDAQLIQNETDYLDSVINRISLMRNEQANKKVEFHEKIFKSKFVK